MRTFRYTDEKLKEIALAHKDYFTTVTVWNEHAKKEHLPFHAVFVQRFGSWNKTKKAVGLSVSKRLPVYNEENINQIIKEHAEYLYDLPTWEKYAERNKLPHYTTMIKFYKWEDIKNKAQQYLAQKNKP